MREGVPLGNDYIAWEANIPRAFSGDPLWRLQAYRMALFLSDVCWVDVTALIRDRRTTALADQLYRAVGSIGANIAEGYSKGSGQDRARFYEYALGSAREARHWYYNARHILGDSTVAECIGLLERITRLLLVMVPSQRTRTVKEDLAVYDAPE
jgi:four helix bundle protein